MSVIFRYYYKFIRIICISACVFATFISPALSSNNLPSGYTELEYIESTGTQYIDTGVIISDNTKNAGVEFVAKWGSIDALRSPFGAQFRNTRTFCAYNNALYSGDGSVRKSYTIPNDNKIHTLKGEWDASSAVLTSYVDDVVQNTAVQNGSFANVSMWIGSIHGGSGMSPFVGYIYNVQFSISDASVFNGIPARRNSDNVVGMYDTITNTFFTNSGAGKFIAGPAVVIQVATTKYVDTKFNPISTELNTTIGAIKNVVDNTITQADRISALHTGKQNRPDDYNASEKCPSGAKCLLISEADGTLHWYPICNGDGSIFDIATFLASLTSNGNNHYYHGNDTTYREITNDPTKNTSTSQPGSGTGVRQLNETEWAVKWDGNGVVYGTSVCNGNSGTQAVASNTEQTESKGSYCWCKMTSVAGTDGTEHEVSVGLWVSNSGYVIANFCALNCAYHCAANVRNHSDFRSTILSIGN